MKKTTATIVLAIIAVAALVWAASFDSNGLAWFPGFFVSVFCGIKILELHENKDRQNSSR